MSSDERTMRRYLSVLILSLLSLVRIQAQEDPILAGQILLWTEKAESELKAQEKVMALETAGQIWMEDEWKKTARVQSIYNDYLNSFRDIVVYAAQVYGFYQEVDRLVEAFDALGRVIDDHPDGIFAGALSTRRNAIYRDVLMNAVDIVNDIRKVCMSEARMTERDRVEMVFAIRPKLVKMNRQIRRLTRIAKYSTYTDILIEIELIQRRKTDKSAIARACLAGWKLKGRVR